MKIKADPICRHCRADLTAVNWIESMRRGNNKICDDCRRVKLAERRANPELKADEAARARKYREENREHDRTYRNEYMREYYRKNPNKRRAHNALPSTKRAQAKYRLAGLVERLNETIAELHGFGHIEVLLQYDGTAATLDYHYDAPELNSPLSPDPEVIWDKIMDSNAILGGE